MGLWPKPFQGFNLPKVSLGIFRSYIAKENDSEMKGNVTKKEKAHQNNVQNVTYLCDNSK